ncbi:MAG: hypothetical protein U0P45_07730 [Acidimicrobiales bacterium]
MEGPVDVSAPQGVLVGDDEEPEPTPQPPDEPQRGAARRALAWCGRHPLVVAGCIGTVVALANAVWIWRVRHLGGFDPDESSYLSSALRMQRSIDLRHPFALIATVFQTGHGITVPLLSVPLLILGPRDPRTAMMLQPILMVFIAVAIAAITLRITKRPAPAIFASLFVVLLPTMTTAVQSYWYGLGAAAAMAGAMWALLASERATNRWIWWYGVGVGLMLLSRTMTLGYLPACLAAALIVAWPDRRGLKRAIAGFALGIAIAAPWYIANRDSIFGYLFSFGYGQAAAEFGETGFGDRLHVRMERMVIGIGPGWFVPIALALLLFVGVQLVRRKALPNLEERPFLAILAVVLLGTVALVSTANNGVWFELPLVVLTIVVLVSAAAQIPEPAGIALAIAVVVAAVYPIPPAYWLRRWHPTDPASHYEWGFSEYDERFSPRTRSEHAEAAAEWWALSQHVEQAMRKISPDGQQKVFLTTGNTLLYNANVVSMASELDGWNPYIVIPNTTLPAAQRAKWLGAPDPARLGDRERVLVVGVHDQRLWPLDVKTRAFLRQAEDAGFVEVARFQMPRGGHVAILRRKASS